MDSSEDTEQPDVHALFDDEGGETGLVCRVCGALVARRAAYPQAHWAWHEASNGA